MTTFTTFNSAGQIYATFELEEGATPGVDDYPSGGGYISGAYDPDLFYITDPGGTPTITDRPDLAVQPVYQIIADNTDAVSISIPDGTLVIDLENGASQTASGADTLVIKSNGRTGVFGIYIEPPFPYQPVRIEVRANASDN